MGVSPEVLVIAYEIPVALGNAFCSSAVNAFSWQAMRSLRFMPVAFGLSALPHTVISTADDVGVIFCVDLL